MSLSEDDFYEVYEGGELKEIKLTTWKGEGEGVLTLRGLVYSDFKRYEFLCNKVTGKKAMDLLSGTGDEEGYNSAMARNEDHLLRVTMCNAEGGKFFKSDDSFKKWKETIPVDVVNEIICHIECMNELYGGFESMEKVIESYKKK